MKRKTRLIVFSLLPTLIIFGCIEIAFRVLYTIKPEFITAPLPDEFRGLVQQDNDLFWRLIPNVEVRESNGALISINSQGFRGGELGVKKPHNYRILSLGESTTFGAGVNNDATYSALLEDFLNDKSDRLDFQVLNNGVSAYSSFQGLRYLQLFGITYEPDMVLAYFEINDYMPSTLRNHGLDELSVNLTDQQLANSNTSRLSSRIIGSSKFVTFLVYRFAALKVKKMGMRNVQNPFAKIGIQHPNYISGRLAVEKEGRMVRSELNESNLGQRVNEEERVVNLKSIRSLCDELDIPLVIIHPAYLNTKLHTCVLTDYCEESKTPIFESWFSLHPDTTNHALCFFDNMHPNAEGHRRLAHDLADFIASLIEL